MDLLEINIVYCRCFSHDKNTTDHVQINGQLVLYSNILFQLDLSSLFWVFFKFSNVCVCERNDGSSVKFCKAYLKVMR